MTFPIHIITGLVIGEITGDYPAALLGSIIMDTDHISSYIRHRILWKPLKLLQVIIEEKDPWDDQRNYFHSLIMIPLFGIGSVLFFPQSAFVFILSCFIHLVLDGLEQSVLYPYFPFRRIIWQGPFSYCSTGELYVGLVLFIGYIALL